MPSFAKCELLHIVSTFSMSSFVAFFFVLSAFIVEVVIVAQHRTRGGYPLKLLHKSRLSHMALYDFIEKSLSLRIHKSMLWKRRIKYADAYASSGAAEVQSEKNAVFLKLIGGLVSSLITVGKASRFLYVPCDFFGGH